MCCGSLSPLQTVCDSHLCRRAVEDSPDSSSEGWSEPNTCPEGGCQGFFTVFQDTFARFWISDEPRRWSAWR